MNFHAVCRKWRSLSPPCRWSYINSTSSSSATIPYPWLIFFQEEKGAFHFWDPRENVTYHMNTTELPPDYVIHCAKEGWVVISQGARCMFLYEPFTKTRIPLPDLRKDYCLNGICFSSSPMSSDCFILGFSHRTADNIHFYCVRPAWESWICPLFDTSGHSFHRGPIRFFWTDFFLHGSEWKVGNF